MQKLLILLYGIVAYLVGVAGLLCIILAVANVVPYGFIWRGDPPPIHSIVWNSVLVLVWGFIHTAMARPRFKVALTKVIPEPAERATYIFVAGLTSFGLIGFWQQVEGQLWHTENPAIVYLLWALFVFGWAFLLAASFAINHFDLFGLRQVYLNYLDQPRPPLTFAKRFMYRYVRHPIQTGVLIGIWATPSMSATQVVLSIGFTAYIFIGLWFEERDLVREHGDAYLEYKRTAGKVFPKFGGK